LQKLQMDQNNNIQAWDVTLNGKNN
jgi:hypothetical protein